MSSYSLLMVGNFLVPRQGYYSPGRELAARFRQRGHSVICTSNRLNPLLRLEDMVRTVWRRRRDYSLAQVDVFSGRAFFWAECACLALRSIGKPFVLSLHGGALPAFARRWPKRVRALLGAAAAVTAPSSYLAEALQPFRGDIRRIPNPLDLDRFSPRPRPIGGSRLVWVRAFHAMYAPELAVQVLQRVMERHPSARLTMAGRDCGDGSLARTRLLAASLGLQDRIFFAGAIPPAEVAELLASSDVFLNTTTVDNAPVSVMEAMASGLCVVSTDAGGLPHLLRHRTDALLAPSGDAQQLALCVSELLDNPELAERLSAEGGRAARACDWRCVAGTWEQLFSAVVRS